MTNSLLLIGCGKMGGALLGGWIAGGAAAQFSNVIVVDQYLPPAEKQHAGVSYVTSLAGVKDAPSVVILAVKPQQLDDIVATCNRQFSDAPLYISIAAGKTISWFVEKFGKQSRIVRAMPNTPALIGKGMTGLSGNTHVTESDKTISTALFSASGECVWVDESQMDALTALSGSGPAYVFYFMECLVAAGEALGLDHTTATTLAIQTVRGASELASVSDASLTALREQVTSPNGTTQAALDVLMQSGGMDTIITNALTAAKKRAGELSG